jgi:hypothetical protein
MGILAGRLKNEDSPIGRARRSNRTRMIIVNEGLPSSAIVDVRLSLTVPDAAA